MRLTDWALIGMLLLQSILWNLIHIAKEMQLNKSKILYYILAIMAGVFMFIYAGIDDSPGGQLIGLLAVAIGVVGLIMLKKKTSN